MKVRTFWEKVADRIAAVNSCVCLGLDSDAAKLPVCVRQTKEFRWDVVRFNRSLLESTHDLLLAVKFNAAFYEAHGDRGKGALQSSIQVCRELDPGVIVILDYKRADIGNSNNGYVAEGFDYFGADAVTVSPSFGKEAMKPFLERTDKGIVVLCKTSNPGGDEFQDLKITPPALGSRLVQYLDDNCQLPLYQYVAYRVYHEWQQGFNCALVVGATYPEQAKEVREIVGDMPLLIPGLGAQGATAADIVPVAQDSKGGGMIINSSRDIIFASEHEDFAEAARQKTLELRDEINRYRQVA